MQTNFELYPENLVIVFWDFGSYLIPMDIVSVYVCTAHNLSDNRSG